MLTGGSFNFLQREPVGNFYDAQAHAWLHGHWDIPSSILTIEAFVVHGKSYTYFGPVPAVLRLPIVAFTHALDGRLTELSMLAAFTVALVFTARLMSRIRGLVRHEAPVDRWEAFVVGTFLFAVGAGSVLLFLASKAWVYHEDILWGVALSLAAYYYILDVIKRWAPRSLALAGLFCCLAFLSRVSVGVGPVVALALVLAGRLLMLAGQRFGRRSEPSRSSQVRRVTATLVRGLGLGDSPSRPILVAALAMAVLIPIGLYAWVNYTRFGTLFQLPLSKQAYSSLNVQRQAALAANGGSLFGIKFIPTGLVQYLRPDALGVTRLFPWMIFPTTPARVIGNVRFDTIDWASSVPASMPALFLLAVGGLVGIFWPRRLVTNGLSALRVPVLGAAVGSVGVMSIAYVANRYLGDSFPLVVLCALAGLQLLIVWLSRVRRRGLAIGACVGLAVLGVFGLWANLSLGLTYQRLLSPHLTGATRTGFVALQQQVDRALRGGPPSEVSFGNDLPAPAPVYHMRVVGDCAGLYWSDGSQWYAIEQANAEGHFRLGVTLPSAAPGTRQPLVVAGTPGHATYLAIEFLGRDSVSFDYLDQAQGSGWFAGGPQPLRQGAHYVLDVVLDRRLGTVSVRLGNRYMLDAVFGPGLAVLAGHPSGAPATPVGGTYLGQAPFGGPLAPRFAGQIQNLPVDMSICRSLQQRSHRS